MTNSWLAQVAFYLMMGIFSIRFAIFMSENPAAAEHFFQMFNVKEEEVIEETEK